MVRFAGVVVPDIPHHVTQRGNARRFILESDVERSVYLDLLQQRAQRHGVELMGYCLMSNHVHLLAVPHKKDALARSLKDAHGRFACYWNAAFHSSGHVWQGRYYSCPLDEKHLWEALRYIELNPVRANLVPRAPDWQWSSAAVPCGAAPVPAWLEMGAWARRWSTDHWSACRQNATQRTVARFTERSTLALTFMATCCRGYQRIFLTLSTGCQSRISLEARS